MILGIGYELLSAIIKKCSNKKIMVGYEMFASPQRDFTAETAAKKLKELIKCITYENS